jgi:hypothetical protein
MPPINRSRKQMVVPTRLKVAELGTNADPFRLHLYAALAEKDRRLIGPEGSRCAGMKAITHTTRATAGVH